MNRGTDDDLQALRQALPVPADRDFPAGRYHQREEHLMTSWLRMSQRPQHRRNHAIRIALPLGLAAAAAGTVLAYGQTTTVPSGSGSGQAQDTTTTATDRQSLGAISAVAYTIQREPSGDIKIVIEDPNGKPNADKMRADLARLGVTAKVLISEPNCHDTRPSPKPTPSAEAKRAHPAPASGAVDLRPENGKTVAYIHPDRIHAGHTLTFGFERPNAIWPLYIGVEDGNGPDCIPAIPAAAAPVPPGSGTPTTPANPGSAVPTTPANPGSAASTPPAKG